MPYAPNDRLLLMVDSEGMLQRIYLGLLLHLWEEGGLHGLYLLILHRTGIVLPRVVAHKPNKDRGCKDHSTHLL